ncbi:MAG TPA: C40 family peptidase [Pseudonocardiaceae bacterium]|nr:C40 family peptidase [Pseudonocardiaceae bacterium]
MAGISLAALEQPMVEARDKLAVQGGSAGQLQSDLDQAARTLDDYRTQHQQAGGNLAATWTGDRADTFGQASPQVTDNLGTAANSAGSAANTVGTALGIVTSAHNRVQSLIDEFAAKAQPLLAAANTVSANGNNGAALAAQAQLQQLAAQYAAKAASLVDAAKQQLSQVIQGLQTGTTPSSVGASGLGSRDSGGGSGGSDGGSGGGGNGTGPAPSKPIITPPSSSFGSGTTINLPNGLGTVSAPNERAAIAVRAALTQLGVPYQWGGNTPGQGLDCSGLTHWAYGQAGIGIPRLADAQTMGAKVAESDLAPGDLVVWSGHVAMYLGDGKMIEEPHTGDVCHIVPLRTSNAGDAFLGFYRPSA